MIMRFRTAFGGPEIRDLRLRGGLARTVRALLSATTLAVLALAPITANATPAESDAIKISTSGHRSLKWNWTPPRKSERFGHAEVLIAAPIDKVRSTVTDFGHYQQFAPWRFTQSKVVGHAGDDTKVYMEFSVLGGRLKLSSVTRFMPPRPVGNDTEVIEGVFVSGKLVKDSNVIWTLEKVDDNFTVLKCDILMKPDLPINPPQSTIDEELRDAAQQAVDGAQRKAQGHDRIATWTPGNKAG